MPIFEFACSSCGYRFEKLERAGHASVDCPACGSVDVKKQSSTFAPGASSQSCSTSSGGG